MYVVAVKIEIRLPWARSLKDKRMVIRSLKDKFLKRFKVQLTEVGLQDAKERGILAFTLVSESQKSALDLQGKMIDFFLENCAEEIVEIERYLNKY